jgi:hypothetical protein
MGLDAAACSTGSLNLSPYVELTLRKERPFATNGRSFIAHKRSPVTLGCSIVSRIETCKCAARTIAEISESGASE